MASMAQHPTALPRPTLPRVASLIRWLTAHQAEIEDTPYGQVIFDWGPRDVKVKLTRASSVPLALDAEPHDGV